MLWHKLVAFQFPFTPRLFQVLAAASLEGSQQLEEQPGGQGEGRVSYVVF